MPREPEIQPGQAFHLPAAQEKNIGNLMKIFSKREATEALTAMGNMGDGTWSDARDTMGDMRKIVELGGLSTIVKSFEETVKLQIEYVFAPLENQINQLLAEALNPIKDLLQGVANDLSQFVADNPIGGAIGAILGGVLAMFIPGGVIMAPLLQAIGAIIGAFIEQMRDVITPPTVDPVTQVTIYEYYGGDMQAMMRDYYASGATSMAEFIEMFEAGEITEDF